MQAPATAALYTCGHPRATAVVPDAAGRGITVLPRSRPGAPAVGPFLSTLCPPRATEATAGVFADAHRGGFAGRVAVVFTYSLPGTTETGPAIDTPSLPRGTETAAAVVTASLPGVASSEAVSPYSLPRAAMTLATISPNSPPRHTAAVA